MHQRPRKMPHQEHQRIGINQQQDAVHVNHAGQREIQPLAGREFRGRREKHGAEQNEEERIAKLTEHLLRGDSRRGALGRRKLDAHAKQQSRRSPGG